MVKVDKTKTSKVDQDSAGHATVSASTNNVRQNRTTAFVLIVVITICIVGEILFITDPFKKTAIAPTNQGSTPPIALLKQQVAADSTASTATAKSKLASDYAALGNGYLANGSMSSASRTYNQAIQEAPNDLTVQIIAYKGLVNIAINNGDNQTAIKYLNDLIAISQKSNDASVVAGIQIYKAQIAYLQGGQQ